MNIEKMRDEFEAWVKKEKNQFFLGRRDNPQLWHGSDEEISDWKSNPYDHPWTAGAWDGWQVSRATLEISLPKERKLRHQPRIDENTAYNEAIENCRDAIQAAGVKVKP